MKYCFILRRTDPLGSCNQKAATPSPTISPDTSTVTTRPRQTAGFGSDSITSSQATNPSKSHKTAAITGGTVGVPVLLVTVVALAYWWYTRRRQRRVPPSAAYMGLHLENESQIDHYFQTTIKKDSNSNGISFNHVGTLE